MAAEWVFIVAMMYKDPHVAPKLDVATTTKEECLKLVGNAADKAHYWVTDPNIKHWAATCVVTDDLQALQNITPSTPPSVKAPIKR